MPEINSRVLGVEAASRPSLAKIDAIIAGLSDPWNRTMLQNWRDHYWAEVIGDLDALMATLAPDPVYEFYGATPFGPLPSSNTTEAARGLYSSVFDTGYRPAGPLSELLVAFHDDLLMLQFKILFIYPGSALQLPDQDISPDADYEVTFRVSESHFYDRATGLMKGETVFLSAPEQIVRCEP